MNTTTLIILNGLGALALLASLALVMLVGHRVAGEPLEAELRLDREEPELERAA
jgi:hypothetical protein